MAGELTLVCAPAGFGKTSLLADWARRRPLPVAWLSLEAGDNDPIRFWRSVAAALDRAQAGLGQRVTAVLQGPPAPLEAVVTAVVNELAAQPGPVVLVVDDDHLIEAPPVHGALAGLLERQPQQLRLVLASRADPPLPLARLRARGQLAELRQRDLRFSPEEATEALAGGHRAGAAGGQRGRPGRPDRGLGGRAAAGRPVAARPPRPGRLCGRVLGQPPVHPGVSV